MTLKIYGTPMSPFVRKVRACMHEKGLDYEIDPVSPFDPPEGWRTLSPLGRVPVLRDTEIGTEGAAGTLSDSSAICVYLERIQPEPPLYPAAAFQHARACWLEEFADTELAVRIGFGILRTVIAAPMNGEAPDWETAEATVREKLPRSFAYLESQLDGDDEFFCGEAPSIADISITAQLIGFRHAGFQIDTTLYPKLAIWLERMLGRRSIAAIVAEDKERLGEISRL